MKVFISWSGDRSKKAAESLAWWLPKVINAVEPWISTHDIDQGAGWFGEITTQLGAAQFGVFCLTAENLQAPWLLFEAGAVWKGQTSARPCAYLLGLSPADVSGPFAQFQLSEANRAETWKLVQSLNAAMDKGGLDKDLLTEAFDMWWPKLEERLAPVLTQQVSKRPQRKDREILEEILQLVRRIASEQTTEICPEKFGVTFKSHRIDPAVARRIAEIVDYAFLHGGRKQSDSVGLSEYDAYLLREALEQRLESLLAKPRSSDVLPQSSDAPQAETAQK